MKLDSKDGRGLYDYFHTTFFCNYTRYIHTPQGLIFSKNLFAFTFHENSGNDNEDENVPKPFYGPPGNCVDLAKLGYTLNGYYLVNGSKSSSNIEVVLCRFQLPSGVNESIFFKN